MRESPTAAWTPWESSGRNRRVARWSGAWAARSPGSSWITTSPPTRVTDRALRRCCRGRVPAASAGSRSGTWTGCPATPTGTTRGSWELAERYGVQLATATGEYDLATSSGRMLFRISGALARRESEHKGERLMVWNDQRAQAGMPHAGGTRPFGFQRNGVDHEPAEAALIAEATRRLLGGEPMHAIVNDWRTRGIVTPTGRAFHTTTLRRVLTNPRIAGIRVHRGEQVGAGAWAPIIGDEDFRRLVRLFSGRSRQHIGRPHTYTYSGILRCGREGCDGRMVGSSRGASAKAYGCQSCDRTWISAESAEGHLDEAVMVALSGPRFAEALRRKLAAAERDDPTAEQLDRDRHELKELARLKGQGRFTIEEWLALRDPIQRRIRDAEAKLDARPDVGVLVDLPKSEDKLRQAWARWPVERKRRVLNAVLDYVTVLPAGRGGRRQVTDRLRPHWKF